MEFKLFAKGMARLSTFKDPECVKEYEKENEAF